MKLFDYERAHAIMKKNQLDAIVVNSRVHREYIADYSHFFPILEHTQLTWYSTGNPTIPGYVAFACIPRDQKIGPFLIHREGNEKMMAKAADIWISDIRYWKGDPVKTLAETLEDKGLAQAQIGFELDSISHWLYKRIEYSLPGVIIRNAEGTLAEMRQIKTEEEIRRLKKAAHAAEAANEEVWSKLKEGLTYNEVKKIIHTSLAANEADCNMVGLSFSPQLATSPQPLLAQGNSIRTDIGAEYKGYLSDISRVKFFGEPSNISLYVYKTIQEAFEITLENVKAGVKVTDLLAPGTKIASKVGGWTFLHGIGRVMMEPRLTDVLMKGEVVCVEAETVHPEAGVVCIEDEVVVTEDGFELLTTQSSALEIIEPTKY